MPNRPGAKPLRPDVDAALEALAHLKVQVAELKAQSSGPPGAPSPILDALRDMIEDARKNDLLYRRLLSEARLYPNILSTHLVRIVEAIRDGS